MFLVYNNKKLFHYENVYFFQLKTQLITTKFFWYLDTSLSYLVH